MKATRKSRKAKAKKKANKKINEQNHNKEFTKNKYQNDSLKMEVTEVTTDNLDSVLNSFFPSTSHYVDITDELIEERCNDHDESTKEQLIDLKNKGWQYDSKRDCFVAPPQDDDIEFFGFENF